MRMTVGKKLAAGFGIVVLCLIVNLWISITRLAGINERLNHIVNISSAKQLLSAKVEEDIVKISRAEKNLVLGHKLEETDKYARNIDEYEDQMNEKLDKLESITTTEGKKDIADFKKFYDDWKKINLEVRRLSREAFASTGQELSLKARDLSMNEGRVLLDNAEAAMTRIVERNEKRMLEDKRISDRNYVIARNLLVAVFISAVLISMVIAIFITRGITRSLRVVCDRISDIAGRAGDLTTTVPVTSKDEVGDLTGGFNKMLSGLRGMVVRIIGSSQSVSAASQQLSSAAQQSNATMQEVSSAIDQLAKGAQTQAQRVEETSKVMEQLNASIAQSAQSAQAAASASVQASKSAQDGANTTREMVSMINKIFDSTTVSSEAVKKLGQRSEQIAEIVGAITDVADQTNLLALNAAIEAARAGEQGRGFAVVAEEVRKLAESSAKSATEIGKLIKEVVKDTREAVESMDNTFGQATQGKETVANTSKSVEEILQAVQNVSSMLQQISAATQQMSSGAKQVVQSVEDVATIAEEASSSTQQASASTEQMLATMQEMAASAQSLAEMGIELNNLVAEFKTGEEGRTAKPESRAPKPRQAKPMAKRLAEARKRMQRIGRPSPQRTEEEANLEEAGIEEVVGVGDTEGRHNNG